MANASRARVTLMRNLPKRGWTVEEGKGTFKDLIVIFGEEEWEMTQGSGKDEVKIGKGPYGKTQMKDVRAAASKAGTPFGPGAAEGTGKPPKSTGPKKGTEKPPESTGPKKGTDKKKTQKKVKKTADGKSPDAEAD